jgi:hypothetical protein
VFDAAHSGHPFAGNLKTIEELLHGAFDEYPSIWRRPHLNVWIVRDIACKEGTII